MAMVAGPANIGQVSATDFIAAQSFGSYSSKDDVNRKVSELVGSMEAKKKEYWEKTDVPSDDWPGPTILMATAALGYGDLCVWRVLLGGSGSKVSEVLLEPGIRLEGAYDEVFSLVYGYNWEIVVGICKELGVSDEKRAEALKTLKVLRPIDRWNLWAMPIQDAIDMAVFFANTQVEMDRFLPGTPACGGPIDVMVLKTTPKPEILHFPGKTLRHPRGSN
jgi:hypothetical protein